MVQLFDKTTGALLGTITDDQFQFLVDRLEEESDEDDDYYVNPATLSYLEEEGADPTLLDALRQALGGKEEAEIRWKRS
jgi:processive 1,2-diacylglycerol beta-glucosyltransferase